MDCIYIAPLSKALYSLCLSFTHTFTHQRQLAAMQGTNQLVRSNWGLGVLLRDTSTRPGWDRTGNPPTARLLLYLLSHIAPTSRCRYQEIKAEMLVSCSTFFFLSTPNVFNSKELALLFQYLYMYTIQNLVVPCWRVAGE